MKGFTIPMMCIIYGIALIAGAMYIDSTERRYDLCGEVMFKIKPYTINGSGLKYEVITAIHSEPVQLSPKQYAKTKIGESVCSVEREYKYRAYCITMCVVGIVFIVIGACMLMAYEDLTEEFGYFIPY